MSIYVGNLSYEVTENDLKGVFAEYGTVKRVQLPNDRETGRPRGCSLLCAVCSCARILLSFSALYKISIRVILASVFFSTIEWKISKKILGDCS